MMTLSKTEAVSMRALRMDRTGSLEGLYVADIPTPEPGVGDVLIRIAAASINPSDLKNVQGAMEFTTTPRTPGRDFAGVVEQGPAEWIGKRVWGSGGQYGFTRDGAHAEFLVRAVDEIGPLPSNLSDAEAAACGVPFITAQTALFDAGALSSDDLVVIIGAAGAVGSSAVQLASRAGATVIGVLRNDGQVSVVEGFGVRALVCPDGDRLGGAVREMVGRGASLIFDTVGGSMLRSALGALGHRGRLVEIAAPQREVTFNLLDFYHHELRLIGVDTLKLDASTCARILEELRPGFESGELKPPAVGKRARLEDAPSGYVDAASGKVGKVVIEIG